MILGLWIIQFSSNFHLQVGYFECMHAYSTRTKITKLLSNLSLCDHTSSQMRTKASSTPSVTNGLLKKLWLGNLPEQVRIILSADDKMDPNKYCNCYKG